MKKLFKFFKNLRTASRLVKWYPKISAVNSVCRREGIGNPTILHVEHIVSELNKVSETGCGPKTVTFSRNDVKTAIDILNRFPDAAKFSDDFSDFTFLNYAATEDGCDSA